VGRVLQASLGSVAEGRVGHGESVEPPLKHRVAVVKRAEIVGREDRHVYLSRAGSVERTGSFKCLMGMPDDA
jgi:hypothetical protein